MHFGIISNTKVPEQLGGDKAQCRQTLSKPTTGQNLGLCVTQLFDGISAEEGRMPKLSCTISASILHPEPPIPDAPDLKKPQGRSRTLLNFPVTSGPGFFMGPCLPWARSSWGIPVWRRETPACATRNVGAMPEWGVSPCLA